MFSSLVSGYLIRTHLVFVGDGCAARYKTSGFYYKTIALEYFAEFGTQIAKPLGLLRAYVLTCLPISITIFEECRRVVQLD